MALENSRAIPQSIVFASMAALTYFGHPIGFFLTLFFAVMLFQSAFTNRCPIDLVLRPMGFKKQSERI